MANVNDKMMQHIRATKEKVRAKKEKMERVKNEKINHQDRSQDYY